MKQVIEAEGFAELVRDYGERAFRLAYHLTGNIEDSHDLVQEAFRRVLARWDQYDPALPLENWCFMVLRHLYVDGLRRYERSHLVSLDAPVCAEEGRPLYLGDILPGRDEELLAALEREENMSALRDAVERLSYEHRAIITLCDMEGMSYGDIAQVLRCPLGTVRSRLSRAREELKKLLMEYVAGRETVSSAGSRIGSESNDLS